MSESISKPGESIRRRGEPCEPTLKLGEGKLGQPQWAGCYLHDWEILVYEQAECWEACFFKWDVHHEHVKAFSMEDARSKAERRIRVLENAAQKPDPGFYEDRASQQGRKSRTQELQLGVGQ